MPSRGPVTVNHKQLKQRCLASIEDYHSEGEVTTTKDGVYIFKDNQASILAVAHLDTVQHYKHYERVNIAGEEMVFNAQVDDRLGAYVILDLLPQFGLRYDILLTEGEEVGRSTAAYFQTEKQYNWLFQFDRNGTDVVAYDYDDADLRNKLTSVGFRVGHGSFTDICKLYHLRAKGFNVGCGYYENHGKFARFTVKELTDQVELFLAFYAAFHDSYIPHDPSARKSYGYGSYYDRWGDWEDYRGTGTTGKHGSKSKNDNGGGAGEDDSARYERSFRGPIVPAARLVCPYCHQRGGENDDRAIVQFGACVNCCIAETILEPAVDVVVPPLVCPICSSSGQLIDDYFIVQRDMCRSCYNTPPHRRGRGDKKASKSDHVCTVCYDVESNDAFAEYISKHKYCPHCAQRLVKYAQEHPDEKPVCGECTKELTGMLDLVTLATWNVCQQCAADFADVLCHQCHTVSQSKESDECLAVYGMCASCYIKWIGLSSATRSRWTRLKFSCPECEKAVLSTSDKWFAYLEQECLQLQGQCMSCYRKLHGRAYSMIDKTDDAPADDLLAQLGSGL